jgi:hypothetical protein
LAIADRRLLLCSASGIDELVEHVARDLLDRGTATTNEAGVQRRLPALDPEGRAIVGQARDLLHTIAEDHGDIGLRRLRVEACISLGDAYSALAAVDTNTAATHRRSGCDTYQRSFEIMQEMRSGRVPAADEITEMELAGKIAKCAKLSQ